MSHLSDAILGLASAVRDRHQVDVHAQSLSPVDFDGFETRQIAIPDELTEWFRTGIRHMPPYRLVDVQESLDLIDQMADDPWSITDESGEPLRWSEAVDTSSCGHPTSWPNAWVPIAHAFESGVVFVDLMPGPKGRLGQVVHAWPDEMLVDVQGTSISDWLNRIARGITENAFDPDEFLITPQEIHRAYPISTDD